jgi:hypothetical protein
MAGADASHRRPRSHPRRSDLPRVASDEYKNISFIHEFADHSADDITAEILDDAALPKKSRQRH